MPGRLNEDAMVVEDSGAAESPLVYRVPASTSSFKPLVSWGNGNQLHVSYIGDGQQLGGSVVGLKLGNLDSEVRRIAYGSLPAFALLQSQRQALRSDTISSDWWENVLEYSRSISGVLDPEVEDSSSERKNPTLMKSVWELIELFYVDKGAASWLPERLLDWLASHDKVISSQEATVHSKVVLLEQKLTDLQFPEDEPDYWDGICSALAVGWLDVATSFLRMHGSYRLDQLDDRQTENGLVEAVTLLIAKLPRLRPSLPGGALGVACSFKPDFAKAWEKWRAQVSKLESSTFWAECTHRGTLHGLKKILQLLLGNVDVLASVTFHWMELLVAHLLYVIPFSLVAEGMQSVAAKCKRLKPSGNEELFMAILEGDTEVLLAECSLRFNPWMMAHIGELLTAKSTNAQTLLQEERPTLGGLSMQELHRLIYAQVLSSHPLTWQLAPVYLASCPKQGLGMLENLLLNQRLSGNNKLALKALEICRLYELANVETAISRAVGIHCLKHGKQGAGIVWLQRAKDEQRLAVIADEILEQVSAGGAKLQHLESLLDLLGSGATSIEGVSFLGRYKAFKSAIQQVRDMRHKELYSESSVTIGRTAADSLLQLLKPDTLPQRFWFSLLQDSVELLEWPGRTILNETETFALQYCLQHLFLAKDRGDKEVVASLEKGERSSTPVERVRLALATNLGRAMLQA